jgi:AbrB family looped-hinge helix DNA binding protein
LSWSECFYGSVTVGERGQIVIPAEARTFLNISAGDKLLVMKHPDHRGLMLFSIEEVREFLNDFQQGLNRLEEQEG